MESPNLDEISPTSKKNNQSNDSTSSDISPADADMTQPMPVTQAPTGESTGASTPEQTQQDVKASLSETQPSPGGDGDLILPPDIPEQPSEPGRGKRRWILWAIAVVIVLALIAAGSGFAGYNSAVSQRTRYQSTQVAGEAANQYTLALQDITLGNFDRARQRLEYLIQIDPNFPDASTRLAYVLAQQRVTATPTIEPSPTVTPTPDYRGRDDLYAQAQSQLTARDWTATIDTLLLLRKKYPDYMAVKVDDMLFVALRNRGVDKIAQLHDLEGGNYDLTLAERFGPLDAEARNWRDWADLYIRGASFWDVDWAQAVYYFAQLADAAPSISDTSGWTASNRYMDALLGYGDWLAANGQWCDAQTQYDTYMTLLASPQVEPTAAYASDKCNQQNNPPAPPPAVTETTTPVTDTPAPPMETPTPGPTDTPGTTPYP